ncbi:methionine--tRNA ligase [Kiloniella litopenaei]|uniref:Methionine--tRNA ligase n=1 Tax=Kiloniella litopenaei TaxID=1549748 RepID=A0A0M2R5W9_9PROT|nr:methionine--tRNA ligase [Kiloniella litopenaei]KKJ75385.1 methionine--tRNA ligase [Kiloniella litopenaei]
MTGSENGSYYITTPIYYVNDKPHIGHAYTTLACDVLARFKRLDGYDVKFLTGTDEHGQKVETSAEKSGIDPQTFTDQVSQNFRDLTQACNFSNDDFIRTTEDRHKKACQNLWRVLEDKGFIYLGSYAGWYAVRDEAFYTETELTKNADGKRIAPTGAEVEWVEEPSYFFKLSAFEDKLLALYENDPSFVGPDSRRNEVISFVKGGLRDLSVSRTTFKWGVQVPGNNDHIMYVWLDALTNYLTAVGYPDESATEYQSFWPADLHMVGKDILRFHAVYWPAFLMAADLPLPKRIFAHGWWTNEGQKISKSIGNVIDPNALIEEYGLDQVRYFMMREVPFGKDGDYSKQAMISRMNGDLANDIGNLAQRVLSMVFKNCEGKIPEHGDFTDADRELLDSVAALHDKLRSDFDKQSFHRGLEAVWNVISAANKYVDEQAPWTLKKTDLARMGTVLYVLAETIRQIAILLQPVMPESMEKMLNQLSLPADTRTFVDLKTPLKSGVEIEKPQGVFPRYVEEEGA